MCRLTVRSMLFYVHVVCSMTREGVAIINDVIQKLCDFRREFSVGPIKDCLSEAATKGDHDTLRDAVMYVKEQVCARVCVHALCVAQHPNRRVCVQDVWMKRYNLPWMRNSSLSAAQLAQTGGYLKVEFEAPDRPTSFLETQVGARP